MSDSWLFEFALGKEIIVCSVSREVLKWNIFVTFLLLLLPKGKKHAMLARQKIIWRVWRGGHTKVHDSEISLLIRASSRSWNFFFEKDERTFLNGEKLRERWWKVIEQSNQCIDKVFVSHEKFAVHLDNSQSNNERTLDQSKLIRKNQISRKRERERERERKEGRKENRELIRL